MAQLKPGPPQFGAKQAVQLTQQEFDTRISQILNQGVEWIEAAGGIRVTLYNLAPGKWDLLHGHRIVLEDAAKFLRGAKQRRVWILGNAEVGEGMAAFKQTISLMRAEAAKQTLFGFGVKADQLLTELRGGVIGCGDKVSAANRSNPGYDPGRYRNVELCLLNMNIERALDDQANRLRADGYTV